MAAPLLKYPLQQGYLHHWLVAGPIVSAQSAQASAEPAIAFDETPAERATFAYQEQSCTWQAVTCGDDHFVDLTGRYPRDRYLTAWAYAQIEAPAAAEFTWTLTTNGPADVWLNGQHCHQQTEFGAQASYSLRFSAQLQAGINEVFVRFENVTSDVCPYVLALRLAPTAELSVCLPTTIQAVERRQKLERLFAAAYLDRAVYHREQELKVRWPEELGLADEITIRLQTPNGRIYAEAHPFWVKPGAVANLGRVYQVPDGAYQVVLLPRLAEYYEQGMKVQRRLDLQIVNGKYAETAYGTYAERRLEALDDAARRNLNLFSEVAKMALGRWAQVTPTVIEKTLASLNQPTEARALLLVGLCGLLARYGADSSFPPGLTEQVESCLHNFTIPSTGNDASECQQLLWSTCELLVGQFYPEQHFAHSGQSGAWHRTQGETQVLVWLRQRAAGGFRDWDGQGALAVYVLALTHLVDLAENGEVAEMAAVVLDKLCFTLALNSFKGVFGSSHGSTEAAMIQGGRLEATAGLGRLLWGLGSFNAQIVGTVSLACATYELPLLIAQIANDQPEALWSREHHTTEGWEVNKVTYKTPDYMLASAQDYYPGSAGDREHLWQATLSPDAVVFVTHPCCVSTDEAHRPNFWRGNARLPRVAQWREVLVAIHQLPDDDWLGFTHAYFPTAAFDEYTLRNGWAFARQGNGYLALTTTGKLELITTGGTAFYELRSYGPQQIWLCHLGRAAQDGSFAEFVQKVLALDITFEALSVHATTLRGESIDFGWHGPLLVNEIEQPLSGFKHYENLYCVAELNAPQMEIQFQDQLMRLDFSSEQA